MSTQKRTTNPSECHNLHSEFLSLYNYPSFLCLYPASKIWGKWLREVQTIDKKSSVFKCALVLLCRYFSNRSRLASLLWSFSCDHKMIWDYSCVTKMSLTHPRNNLQIWTKNKSEANTQRESIPSSTPISSADSWRKSAKKIIRRKNIIHVIIPSMNPRLNNYSEIYINFIALQILRIIL